jgi:hypothetical protein
MSKQVCELCVGWKENPASKDLIKNVAKPIRMGNNKVGEEEMSERAEEWLTPQQTLGSISPQKIFPPRQ